MYKVPGFAPITFSENLNYWWESLLEVQRQNIAGGCQQTFENKKFAGNDNHNFSNFRFSSSTE